MTPSPPEPIEIDVARLLRGLFRVARITRLRNYETGPKWVVVRDAYGVGSTSAHQICRQYGFNPDEEV